MEELYVEYWGMAVFAKTALTLLLSTGYMHFSKFRTYASLRSTIVGTLVEKQIILRRLEWLKRGRYTQRFAATEKPFHRPIPKCKQVPKCRRRKRYRIAYVAVHCPQTHAVTGELYDTVFNKKVRVPW